MIMRDGEFAAMMQQQEEEEAQKFMEKEHQAMTSMTKEEAFLLIQSVPSMPHNLGVASKVTILAMDSMFVFADFYFIYKQYLESLENMPRWT